MTGTPTVGEVLTAHDGTWSGASSVGRRWLRCLSACRPIAGETDRGYRLIGDDATATVRVEVTAAHGPATASATPPATPAIDRARFTQVLCRDPRTGAPASPDGALPDGLDSTAVGITRPALEARCASGGGGIGLAAAAGAPATASYVASLEYRGASGVHFAGAAVYRHAALGGAFSASIITATWLGVRAEPLVELCAWTAGCTARGTAAGPFAPANRVDVPVGPADGFSLVFGCEASRCAPGGTERAVLAGALVRLRDSATPRRAGPVTGGLAASSPLGPAATLAFAATDGGSGLHRVLVTVDGVEVAERRLCASGGDAYEYASRTPCPPELSPSLTFDTSAWPKAGRLRVYLEDAGRNTAVLVNRAL